MNIPTVRPKTTVPALTQIQKGIRNLRMRMMTIKKILNLTKRKQRRKFQKKVGLNQDPNLLHQILTIEHHHHTNQEGTFLKLLLLTEFRNLFFTYIMFFGICFSRSLSRSKSRSRSHSFSPPPPGENGKAPTEEEKPKEDEEEIKKREEAISALPPYYPALQVLI